MLFNILPEKCFIPETEVVLLFLLLNLSLIYFELNYLLTCLYMCVSGNPDTAVPPLGCSHRQIVLECRSFRQRSNEKCVKAYRCEAGWWCRRVFIVNIKLKKKNETLARLERVIKVYVPLNSMEKVINLLCTILRYLSLICNWWHSVIRLDLIGLVIDFQIKEATIDLVMTS